MSAEASSVMGWQVTWSGLNSNTSGFFMCSKRERSSHASSSFDPVDPALMLPEGRPEPLASCPRSVSAGGLASAIADRLATCDFY